MGKNVQHVQHVKSNVVENGSPKLPTPSVLAEGEIAINFAEGYETLSIKSSSGNIKTFSSDEYYTEQKLGSGFTGANSAVTVTDVIVENEEIISSALTDLDDRKLDASAYTPTDLSNYYTKDETSGKTEISTALSGKQNTLTTGTGINITNDVISVNADQIIDSTTSASTNAVSTSAVYGFVTSYTPSITVDQVLDNTTSASTNPVSSKAVYDAVTDNELVWTNAYVALSGEVSAHTENTEIHVTAADKEKLHTHSNKTYLDAITGNVGTMAYQDASSYSSATQVNTALADKVDTTAFTSHTGSSVHMTTTEKTNLDSLATNIAAISGITATKVSNWDGAATDSHTHSNKSTLDEITATSTAINSLTGSVGTMAFQNTSSYSSATEVNTALGNKLEASDVADFFDDAKYELSGTTHVINFYNGSTVKATIDADDFIKDGMISAVTLDTKSGTTYLVIEWNTDAGIQTTELNIGDLFEADNYYTKSQTSGATELTTAFSTKANTATTLAGYGITDAYTKSETSGATEISTALGGKLDASEYATFSAATNAAIEANATAIAGNKTAIEANATAIAGNKTAIEANATAIAGNKTAIEANATNIAAHTADTTIHFTTGTVQTQIDNSISGKVNTSDIVSAITPSNSGSTAPIATKVVAENELIVSNALIDLDERKLDASAYTPTDLSNYYTKDETSGATEISNALGAKVNSATYTAYTAATATEIGSKASQSDLTAVSGVVSSHTTAINDLSGQSETIAAALVDLNTNKLDASAYTPTDLSNYYTKSETSGATELSTALAGKSGTGHTHVSSGVTAMTGYAKASSGSSIATGDTLNQAIGKLEASVDDKIGRDEYEDDMFVVATSLTDLQTNKLDASAYTPTDLSNYYTKSQTSGASEISTALNGKANSSHNQASNTITAMTSYAKAASGSSITTGDTLNQAIGKLEAYVDDLNSQSETVAAALVDLYNKIGDIETLLSQI